MFILLCSPHSFLLIELLTTSLILISFFFFFFVVALPLKSPTRGVSINYGIVLYCNLVPRSLADEAEGEIWSNTICTRHHLSGM